MDEIFKLRTKAVMSIMAYFRVAEPLSMGNKMMVAKPAPELTRQLPPLQLAQEPRSLVFGRVGKIKRCFICVVSALTLYPDDPSLQVLCILPGYTQTIVLWLGTLQTFMWRLLLHHSRATVLSALLWFN